MKLPLFSKRPMRQLPVRPLDLHRFLEEKLGRKSFSPEARRFLDMVKQDRSQGKSAEQ